MPTADHININVAGVVLRNQAGLYLMVQEKQRHVYGLWNIPAGHQDPGETLQEAAVREAYEEVNLKVELISNKPVYIGPTATKNHTFHGFSARVISGEVKIPKDEILKAEWFTFSQIEELNRKGKIRGPSTMASIQKVENAYSGR